MCWLPTSRGFDLTINWLVAKTGDFTSKTTLGTGGFWSLAIEEQDDLMWPAVVLLLSRRALLRTCVGLAIFSITARFVMAQTGWSWAAIFTATFARFDTLAIGGALAIVARTSRGLSPLRRYAWMAAGLALAGLAAVDVVVYKLLPHVNREYVLATQLALLPLLWGSSLVLTQTAAPTSFLTALTQTRLLRTFGKFSYSLYLFHGHLVILPSGIGYKIKEEWIPKVLGSVLPAQLFYVLITFATCLGLSWLSWHLFENQFLKLKRYFPSGREIWRSKSKRLQATTAQMTSSTVPFVTSRLLIAKPDRETS